MGHPREWKNKTARHVPSAQSFIVTGGGTIEDKWVLKDAQGNLYPLEECQPTELNQLEFDLRKLKAVLSLKELTKYFDTRGQTRFLQVWAEFEKDPVECMAVAIFYCDGWKDFSDMCNVYGVSKERSPELNQRFRKRLEEKGLNELVRSWHKEYNTNLQNANLM